MAITHTQITYAFPLDSIYEHDEEGNLATDENGFPIADRLYHAEDLRGTIARMVSDGVETNYLDELLPYQNGGKWFVSTGGYFVNGLYVPVTEECPVIDQSDITTNHYAFIVVAGLFDEADRCGDVYAVLSQSPSYTPLRNESTWELVLARVDWRGTMTDYRMDNSMCGPVTAVHQPDTESFMASLHTALDQFNLNVGEVSSLPSGSTPTVTVRKPVEAGGDVYIDFGIPRGAKGEDGKSASGLYIQEDRPTNPEEGTVWMGTDSSTRQIEHLEVYEVTGTYPGEVYPGEAYPGGNVAWTPYTIDPSLIASA